MEQLLIIILFIILLCLLSIILIKFNKNNTFNTFNKNNKNNKFNKNIQGGGKKINNFGDIAIDTLNVISFINNKPIHNQNEIIIGIHHITPILKKQYSGRIMFILKDKNTNFNTSEIREKYKKLAHELKIFIYITENYEKGPTWKLEKRFDSSIHSQHARDDLYLLILANQYKCPVITGDNFRDILEFKGTIAPFKILSYDWFTIKQPIQDFIMPSNIDSKKIYDYSKILRIKPINVFKPINLFKH